MEFVEAPAALPRPRRWRRPVAELAILAVTGLLLGVIEPFGTGAAPVVLRFPYWLLCIVGGGAIGIGCERVMRRTPLSLPLRVFASSVIMTLPTSILVILAGRFIFRQASDPGSLTILPWNVFAIALPLMTVRALVWHRPPPIIETRTVVETRILTETKTVVEPPLPSATAAFRQRLSAKRRSARLIAIEAEDHYLRVHTDRGEELLAGRLSDTLVELAAAHGYHVHRSWWIAADAIERVTWDRGSGEALLAGGLSAPISRRRADILKSAGW